MCAAHRDPSVAARPNRRARTLSRRPSGEEPTVWRLCQARRLVRTPPTPTRSASRRGWPYVLVGTAVVGLPLVVAAVALHGRHWYPVLDLAMTEFRVRDVFGPHTPLIGLPGRIGEYPNQGSHPGPLSFYLLAPPFRLLGSSPWALEVGAIVVHLGAIATALWIGWRRRGRLGVAAVGAVLVVAIRG